MSEPTPEEIIEHLEKMKSRFEGEHDEYSYEVVGRSLDLIASLRSPWIAAETGEKKDGIEYLTMVHWYGEKVPMIKKWIKRLERFSGDGVVIEYTPIPESNEP